MEIPINSRIFQTSFWTSQKVLDTHKHLLKTLIRLIIILNDN